MPQNQSVNIAMPAGMVEALLERIDALGQPKKVEDFRDVEVLDKIGNVEKHIINPLIGRDRPGLDYGDWINALRPAAYFDPRSGARLPGWKGTESFEEWGTRLGASSLVAIPVLGAAAVVYGFETGGKPSKAEQVISKLKYELDENGKPVADKLSPEYISGKVKSNATFMAIYGNEEERENSLSILAELKAYEGDLKAVLEGGGASAAYSVGQEDEEGGSATYGTTSGELPLTYGNVDLMPAMKHILEWQANLE
ncbi:MAG TPA: hypothetical protein VI933_03195 [archaeon]|nr:hypothetical protein [archaeon]